jgi:hypothetical protein
MEQDDDGLRNRARITEVLDNHEQGIADNIELKKFRCLIVGDDEFEEILSYNEIM